MSKKSALLSGGRKEEEDSLAEYSNMAKNCAYWPELFGNDNVQLARVALPLRDAVQTSKDANYKTFKREFSHLLLPSPRPRIARTRHPPLPPF